MADQIDERLLCRCELSCDQRATQEDGLCDTCREYGGPGHMHWAYADEYDHKLFSEPIRWVRGTPLRYDWR